MKTPLENRWNYRRTTGEPLEIPLENRRNCWRTAGEGTLEREPWRTVGRVTHAGAHAGARAGAHVRMCARVQISNTPSACISGLDPSWRFIFGPNFDPPAAISLKLYFGNLCRKRSSDIVINLKPSPKVCKFTGSGPSTFQIYYGLAHDLPPVIRNKFETAPLVIRTAPVIRNKFETEVLWRRPSCEPRRQAPRGWISNLLRITGAVRITRGVVSNLLRITGAVRIAGRRFKFITGTLGMKSE